MSHIPGKGASWSTSIPDLRQPRKPRPGEYERALRGSAPELWIICSVFTEASQQQGGQPRTQTEAARTLGQALAADFCLVYTKQHEKTPKPAAADLACKQAVIYARVSSKEQEKEGFSIPAQLKLLKEYAAAQRASRWRRNTWTWRRPSRPAAPPSARWSPISRRIRPSA